LRGLFAKKWQLELGIKAEPKILSCVMGCDGCDEHRPRFAVTESYDDGLSSVASIVLTEIYLGLRYSPRYAWHRRGRLQGDVLLTMDDQLASRAFTALSVWPTNRG
jgi:hypothetical protein